MLRNIAAVSKVRKNSKQKPKSKEEATRPEFKTCKYTTDAIVSEGIDTGELRKVCTEPDCPVHHPKKRPSHNTDEAKWKGEQEKQRKEHAIANATGIRVLEAITRSRTGAVEDARPAVCRGAAGVIAGRNRLAVVARQHGIKKAKDSDSIAKLFAAYLRRAEESALGGLLVEITVLHAETRQNATQVLREAATARKAGIDASALKVKQEFSAKKGARVRKGDREG